MFTSVLLLMHVCLPLCAQVCVCACLCTCVECVCTHVFTYVVCACVHTEHAHVCVGIRMHCSTRVWLCGWVCFACAQVCVCVLDVQGVQSKAATSEWRPSEAPTETLWGAERPRQSRAPGTPAEVWN